MNLFLPIVLAALALLPPVPDPPDSASATFAAAVDAAAREAGLAAVGVTAVHVETGRRMAFRGGERFQMASVFKVPVAVAVLDAVAKGRLTLGQEVEVKPSDRRSWGPIDDHWTPGMRVTVERMLEVMLVDSDNTAADLLIRLVGGPRAVERALVDRKVTGIRISLDEKGMGAAAEKDRAAFERGAQNGASPDVMAAFLVRLYRAELLPREATNRILDAMRRCATGERRLKAGLPKGTEIRDKTGTTKSCANDAGIVTLPDGSHIAVVVFVRGGKNAAARDEAIARVARAAWQAFST